MELEGYTIALDASCPTTQVALFEGSKLIELRDAEAPAMQCLLNSVADITASSRLKVADIHNYLYCAGPGSILGIRLSIMAIKTWTSLYSIPENRIHCFFSLPMAAAQHSKQVLQGTNESFIVCSEWKKGYWNTFQYNHGRLSSAIEVWNTKQIEAYSGSRLLLKQRKIGSEPNTSFQPANYSLELFQDSDLRKQLLHPLKHWEVYTPDEKQYATWSGERHRG